MNIAKNLNEFKSDLMDIMEGYYPSFKFEKTIFKIDMEDGSIKMRRGPKTQSILPSSDNMTLEELVEEVIKKYEEFK